jgi:5-methylcytosine-specific restriction endonuclease McrA
MIPTIVGGTVDMADRVNLDALIKREDFLAPEGPDVALSRHQKYQRLVKDKPVPSIQNKRFSNEAKQVKLLEDVLKTAFVCNICGARIDKKSMQLDHVIDKSKGGAADIDNSQWTHPFCNSTFKYAAK